MVSTTERPERPRSLVITDGAMGTELIRAGWPVDRSTALAVLEKPDLVERIHRAYVEAGARVLLTNTFLASECRLESGIDAVELNRRAVELARRAAGARARVLGDLGPLWDLLAPRGRLRRAEAKRGWRRQAAALIDAGADGLVIETLSGADELGLALEAVREEIPRAWLAVSLSLKESECGGIRTLMGEPLSRAIDGLSRARAEVVGFNCGTIALRRLVEVADHTRARGLGPIWIRAAAGAGSPPSSGSPVTPETFGRAMATVAAAGAKWLGGCCGTRPEHIAAISG